MPVPLPQVRRQEGAPAQRPENLISGGYAEAPTAGFDLPAYVLVLRGRDGHGRFFTHHFRVFRGGEGSLVAEDPVYWSDMHGPRTEGTPVTAPAPDE